MQVRSTQGRAPIVIFNMATRRMGQPYTVSGASMFLASALYDKLAWFGHHFDLELIWDSYPIDYHGINPGYKGLETGQRPLFIATTLYDTYFEETRKRMALIKSQLPQARIMIGGPSINTCRDIKDLASFFPEATALVKGDGEKVLPQLVESFSEDPVNYQAIRQLAGIYVRDGSFAYWNNEVNLISQAEMNDLPPVAADPIVIGEISRSDIKSERGLNISTSRGCKKHCSFCSHQYHPVRISWTASRIIQELKALYDEIEEGCLPEDEARRILFSDDDFFHDRQRAKKFLKGIINDHTLRDFFVFGFQGTVSSFYRNGRLDEELLDLLTRVNVSRVVLGTDGFHPEALKILRKGHTWEMAKELMAALHQRKIEQAHHVILTYPSITPEILSEVLANIYEVTDKFGIITIFNVSIVAHEGTAVEAFLNDPVYVESNTGARKLLPESLSLENRALQDCLTTLLKLPVSEGKLPELIEKIQDQRLSELYKSIISWEEKILLDRMNGEDVTLENVLEYTNELDAWILLNTGIRAFGLDKEEKAKMYDWFQRIYGEDSPILEEYNITPENPDPVIDTLIHWLYQYHLVEEFVLSQQGL